MSACYGDFASSECTARLVEPVYVTLEVSGNDSAVSGSHCGQTAVQKRFLAPDLRASAAPMTEGSEKRKRAMNFPDLKVHERMHSNGRGSRNPTSFVLGSKGATQ